jgi:homoserine kinase
VTRVRVRAPASTANIGPGFDCAAAALDLWNELEVSEGGGGADLDHLGVRAFACLAPVDGLTFTFLDRIPRERGLGSSAAVIALGLTAANAVADLGLGAEELLAAGVELEGHADNLAAVLAGGVCLTWDAKIVRLGDTAPAVPVALVPDSTVSTAAARAALPESVPHADATFTAGRATLLGAALASGSGELFANALADRIHEPYRADGAPLLAAVREQPPSGALGSTLSGSGPTVIVWARPDTVEACATELDARFPDVAVQVLTVSPRGAHVDEH